MIGVNTTYVVQLYDDIWSQVFTTDDVDEAVLRTNKAWQW